MNAKVNGVRLSYSERGKGQEIALLLIHGFPLDRRLWAAQMSGLAAAARVITPDLRGHGRSETPAGPLTMDQQADDLAALLAHLGIGRAVVAGLSMGGYIAFAMWRRHPERIRALVLADTRAEPDSVVARANRERAIAQVQQTGAAAHADMMLPRLLSPTSLATPRLATAARKMMAEQSVAGIVGALGGLRDRADSRPTLPTITVPTLVITGAEDALTPPADGAALAAAIPGAQHTIVPKAGHLSPLENPRAFNATVRAFLRGL